MALPKLETPVYSLTLPSSGEQIKFRPFLVKEQKLLILVNQDENKNELFDTLKAIVSGCTFNKLIVESLPMFDIEYLFLKIRAKSVGSKINVTLTCPDDEKTKVPTEVDLDEIELQVDEQHTNMIQITDDIKLVMQYPIMSDVMKLKNTSTMEMFKILNKCIKELHHGETIHNRADMSEKELDDFFESMNQDQFSQVNEFFESMPRLRHYVTVVNPNTKVESKILMEGLDSFLV